jgi:hypothetical protein
MRRDKNLCTILFGKSEEKNILGDLCVDEMTILK